MSESPASRMDITEVQEVLPARRAELVVGALEMVHAALREHGVVLEFRLPEGRAVARDQEQLGLSLAERLQRGLVPEGRLPTLHHQGQTRVDVVSSLLLVLSHVGKHDSSSL